MELDDFTSSLGQINESNFEDAALKLFRFQYKNNLLYQTYVNHLDKDPEAINSLDEIPFLPIRFFKSHTVVCGTWKPEIVFTSSATSGSIVSQHCVRDLDFYLKNTLTIFQHFYGSTDNYHFLALLPSYLERSGSSLIAMIDYFIRKDLTGQSGFYLSNHNELVSKIAELKKSNKKIILWGVSFGLLDLAEKFEIDLSSCIVMETGGMKGRRKEWVREELHNFLCQKFNVKQIHSEYGMTELLSQAYSAGQGYFQVPAWMKIQIRDINDPFLTLSNGRIGGVNVIDLANAHSCAFIETEDLGRIVHGSSFEVLGRADNSDLRGCNLLIA
ncbi:MAG TPA: acyl transferase [Cyclobacteriaceae bacterium]|nr:acyl transferase [Cyclobacteriaceae bacterium]